MNAHAVPAHVREVHRFDRVLRWKPHHARVPIDVTARIVTTRTLGSSHHNIAMDGFGGAVGKDTVSRVWRKVKGDWDAWNARSLADEPIVRLILDGTVVRVRLDRQSTSISLLVVLGVRADGQKVFLAIKNMGGESTEAWRIVLDDLIQRGLRRPQFLIVDGAPGLENAIAAVWNGVPVQRCTVHKHRNLLAHAPERLRQEISADYNDMIYA